MYNCSSLSLHDVRLDVPFVSGFLKAAGGGGGGGASM